MMAKYRKKPVVIDAIQWSGINHDDVSEFASDAIIKFLDDGRLSIRTLEGNLIASPGDWIIKGVKGEVYACKPDIFQQTYEPIG